MAEMNMNLQQIAEKLNTAFAGDARKLVFWYDANAEFAEDIDSLELVNAKVLHLATDNQFATKYFLECEDTTTSYLVYAPFAKPDIRENHLADTILYSKEFFADRASLIMLDLGIDERYKPVVQHYIKFFASKERTQKFYALQSDHYNKESIELALMAILCKSKTASFEEILHSVVTDTNFADNKYLAELEKYDLLTAYWEQAEQVFGYNANNPTLEKLLITMFITYIGKTAHIALPQAWAPFVSYKSDNIIVFLDNMLNSYLYSALYDEIAERIYQTINAQKYFADMGIENLVDCDIFAGIDDLLIAWLLERLEQEDTTAKLAGRSIEELCQAKRQKHYGARRKYEYFVLENAYFIMTSGAYHSVSGMHNVVNDYLENSYKLDILYRYFYYHLDKLDDTTQFEKLRELVENIYTNDYLNKITVHWNTELMAEQGYTGLELQREFFATHINEAKDRVVVLISDAFRYEVAHTLYERLQEDEKCTATIQALQGVLPSYTPLGMAALLPHRRLAYTDDYTVLIDDKPCATTEQRAKILQSYKPKCKCIQFDALKSMNKAELRDVFTGQDVVYVYHNQVDARGDKAITENEVFTACEEAIVELHNFMRRISSQANTHHFFVTADHGFIYKRDKIRENDKITARATSASIGQRYAISDTALEAAGVCSMQLGSILGNNDTRVVSYPLATDIFKVGGAGQNFVHGGSSPQEMLVPLLEVKVERGKAETTTAQLALLSLSNKITNLITSLDFVQTEPVSDIVKETTYRVYFMADNNEKISNENIVIADKKDADTAQRIFRLRFRFKNKKYDKTQKYYLVIFDDKNDMEVLRHEIIMDIAFADDFGFF